MDNLNLHEGFTRKRVRSKLEQFKFTERKSDDKCQQIEAKAINRSSDMSPALCTKISSTDKVSNPEEENRDKSQNCGLLNLHSRQACFRKLGDKFG